MALLALCLTVQTTNKFTYVEKLNESSWRAVHWESTVFMFNFSKCYFFYKSIKESEICQKECFGGTGYE